MFSRTKDSIKKIKYDVKNLSQNNDYIFGTPGNGLNPYYIKDSHIRLQKWAGNLRTNTIDIENDLLGKTRNLNRDNLSLNSHKNHETLSFSQYYMESSFPNTHTMLDHNIVQRKQKIDVLPDRNTRDILFDNPQNHVYNNKEVNTRIR